MKKIIGLVVLFFILLGVGVAFSDEDVYSTPAPLRARMGMTQGHLEVQNGKAVVITPLTKEQLQAQIDNLDKQIASLQATDADLKAKLAQVTE